MLEHRTGGLTEKAASLLSLSAAAFAAVALAVAGLYWARGGFWISSLWIERALWLAIVLAAAAGVLQLFAKWREFPRHRKLLVSALLVGLVAIGVATFDFKSKADFKPQAPALQSQGQYKFSQDGTTPNAERWRSVLSHLAGRPGVRALEVGTYEGRSAIWFLENILTDSSSTITCIDLFDGPYESTFDSNVAAFGGRVKKIRAPSQLGLRNLEPWSYDFAYIDGSHTAKDVLVDTLLTWDLVKPGGIIIFDDYGWTGLTEKLTGEAFTPRIAIDAFLHVLEPYIDIVHKDYQVIVRKRTEFNRQSPQAMPRKIP